MSEFYDKLNGVLNHWDKSTYISVGMTGIETHKGLTLFYDKQIDRFVSDKSKIKNVKKGGGTKKIIVYMY
jgi:hypothetical protein